MLEPIKIAFAQYLVRYHAQLKPTTRGIGRYLKRPVNQGIVWAPSRMVDQAQAMLSLWIKASVNGATTRPPDLPVMVVAMAPDYTPTGRDYSRQLADRHWVRLPDDPKARLFGLRTLAADVRAQLVIFSSSQPTASALAAQFLLFIDATENRRFMADYTFSGIHTRWPVQIQTPENPAMRIDSEAENLTMLAIDINLHATIPLFDAPDAHQPHDGQGRDHDPDDRHGWPVVTAPDKEAIKP